MIGGGAQKITVEIGGKIAASLGAAIRGAQMQVSSLGRNVSRTMNDAAIAGRRSMKSSLDNALWQQAAVGAAGAGIAIGASIRTAARFETVLAEIGKTANVSEAGLQKLSAQVLQLSARSRTNLGPEKLAAGIQDLVAQGLEINDAVASIEALGKVATATNSDLLDVTKTGFQLQNALKIRPVELKSTFDALAFAGKQGAFELKDMAQFMPTIAAAAGSLGIQGKQGAISLAAMMQMVRKDAPDAGQAATRLTDAMLKMTAPDAVRNFKKFGVNIEQVLKDAKAKGLNPMEVALAELQRVTGGDVFKLSQIFGDKEAKLALMSLMKYRKEYARLRDDAGGAAAAGTVERDFQRSLRTFQGTLTSFQNSSQRLGIAVGQALLPSLTRLAEIITPAVEGVASWAAANPGLATGIVAIGGALAGLVIVLPIIAGVVTAIGTIGAALAGVSIGATIAGWLGLIGIISSAIGGFVSTAVAGLGAVGAAAFAAMLPLLPWIALVAGIGAGIYALVRYWPQISTAAGKAWQSVKSSAASAWAGIQGLWGQFTGWVGRVWGEGLAVIRAWGPQVLAVMFPIPALITAVFRRLIPGVQSVFNSIVEFIRQTPGKVADVGRRVIEAIINGLKARAGALFGWVSGAWDRIKSMVRGGPESPDGLNPGPTASGPAPPGTSAAPAGRANGGRVSAGIPYIVGERRRELFVPGMDGAIIPRIAQPIAAAGLASLMVLQPVAPAAAAPPQRPPVAAPAPRHAPQQVAKQVTIHAPVTIHSGSGADPMEIRRQVELAFADIQREIESSHRVLLND